MFRLFRRKKKEDTDVPAIKEIPTEEAIEEKQIPSETTVDEIVKEEVQEVEVFEIKETPFEDKFAHLTHILPESLLEEDAITDQQIILPFIKNVIEQDSSFADFVSPQMLSKTSAELLQPMEEEYVISRREIPPASLAERIEGALFSIGRPIHSNEIIENFEEDSPTIKRAIRKLSRKRKRTSAIVIEEISKDRWVMQLNPIFHEFFQSLTPDLFLLSDERRVLTEIAYRQPISLALVKKMVTGIGPMRVTEICRKLEENNFIVSEQRARSIIFTSTPKFAKSFGFDNESRRLKLQMLWRLKRLMGDFEAEETEDIEDDDETAFDMPVAESTSSRQEPVIETVNGGQDEPNSLEENQIHEDMVIHTEEEMSISHGEPVESTGNLIKEVADVKIEEKGEEE